MSRSKKLELTWIGKEDRPRLEPRILVEDASLSHHAATRRKGVMFDNRLIQGDNLLALKALEAEFTGKVKCIFIDPPYNTGSAFDHYDDGLEHSLWLSMMRDRIEILHRMLSDQGSMWVSLDDNEAHYFKVMCDEIFGRKNFITNVVWQKTLTRRNDARFISAAHDHVLVYAKNIENVTFNKLGANEKQRATYTNRDNDPRGDWLAVPFHAPNIRPNLTYEIVTPGGKTLLPPKGRCWSTTKEKFLELVRDNRIYFGKDGNGMAQRKKFWNESENTMVPWTWWGYEQAGDNREANREAKSLAELANISDRFQTPKPEKLIKQILDIATVSGDLVLDSFAGSGTTGAVAHKMGRRWIMVELGNHATTHIVPRLREVVRGSDVGGVSELVDWKGGGGFRFYRLAPSLLERDRWGNWVISKQYNAAMLAEAVCKHMGFVYAPSQDPSEYWRHGNSSEKDYIFVTTHALTHEMLIAISYDVGPDRHLLVCCKAFSSKRTESFDNLTLTRIPHALLDTCEWGRDDYSLKIARLPEESGDDVGTPVTSETTRGGRTKRSDQTVSLGLFDQSADAEG